MPERLRAGRLGERRRARRSARVRRCLAAGAATVLSFSLLSTVDAVPFPSSTTEPTVDTSKSVAPTVSQLPGRQADEATSEPVSATVGVGAVRGLARPPGPSQAATPSATPGPNDKPAATAPLPARSGSGKRVVFDITHQQVWLVDATGKVLRTYRVSGSKYDQLRQGTYSVFSKSRHAISWHGTETMEYMVRFHRGQNSNIGFHDIPVASSNGKEVQTLSQLGTPLSDGCVRQDVADAKALWRFAPVGTTVVVTRS